jgi:lycopene beta-cyclase
MKHYHYIFTGSGLSALMTVYEMIISGKFNDKTILLLDENQKKANDRTWCFWDEKALFDSIVSKKWKSALFANEKWSKVLDIKPYEYKMIQGLDFYNLVFDVLSKQENIHFYNQKITDFQELGHHCLVKTETENYTCNKIFNSIFNPNLVKNQQRFPLLSQHFIGWFIKTEASIFDENVATFMDFSVNQKGNTRFMYVLPTSKTEALIEYTLFSKDVLLQKEYEDEIALYINKLGISNYEIVDKEQGNIPMTSYKFWKHNSKNIIHIGSMGGWTKASTGFTFKNTVKHAKKLVAFLQSENDFRKFHKKSKFWLYDLLFIDVLYKNNALGSAVFSSLFKKGNPVLIFKFLDGETSFFEDVKVMLKCPTVPFAKALFGRIFKFYTFE